MFQMKWIELMWKAIVILTSPLLHGSEPDWLNTCQAWVARGKFLREFVYLAVEICQRWTLLSATPSFQVRKNFENRQKHQRRGSAWVGQADFGKLELNNRNHSGNCHPLVMNVIHLKHDQFKINAVEFSDLRYPSPFQVFFENSLQARTSLAFKPSLL